MNSKSCQHYIARHEEYLNQLLKTAIIPDETIREALLYTLFPGGKRMRPLLVYLSGELLEIPLAMLDSMAAAIELMHNYSLIHDDLPAMDNDNWRRGKLSCHRYFNEAIAILTGDGLQALAIETLLTTLVCYLPATAVNHITLVLVKACGFGGMVCGQSLDLAKLSKPSLLEADLIEVHTLKTGRLISACMDMVIAASNTPDKAYTKALQTCAHELGLSFQMQDDYLDAYGHDALGKQHASDRANHKHTFAYFYDKEKLNHKITIHFERALHALAPFGESAHKLQTFIQTLEKRSSSEIFP